MMESWIQENPYLLIGLIAAVCVAFLIFFIVAGSKAKKKKKQLLESNSDFVEIIFDYVVSTPPKGVGNVEGYLLYSVNGQQPEVFGRSIVVPAGEVTLDYEYSFRRANATFAKSFGRTTIILVVEPGKKYKVSYDYMEQELELKEA